MREFGDLERAIMDVMWSAQGPYVVREVRERLDYRRPVAYTTVMTVLNILHRKDVLHRSKQGRAWQYWAVEEREEHDARLMTEVLRSGGNELVTMQRFLAGMGDDGIRCFLEAATDADIDRFRAVMHEVTLRRTAECDTGQPVPR